MTGSAFLSFFGPKSKTAKIGFGGYPFLVHHHHGHYRRPICDNTVKTAKNPAIRRSEPGHTTVSTGFDVLMAGRVAVADHTAGVGENLAAIRATATWFHFPPREATNPA